VKVPWVQQKLKINLKFVRQGQKLKKSGFKLCFDILPIYNKHFTLNLSVIAKVVATDTGGFNLLITLYATERTTEPVYPSLILTIYYPKFILMLSSHQHSPFRYFNWILPYTVALISVKHTSEIHLYVEYTQALIFVVKVN